MGLQPLLWDVQPQLAVVAVKPAVLKALTVSGLVKPGGGGRILAFDSVDKAATYFLKAQ